MSLNLSMIWRTMPRNDNNELNEDTSRIWTTDIELSVVSANQINTILVSLL